MTLIGRSTSLILRILRCPLYFSVAAKKRLSISITLSNRSLFIEICSSFTTPLNTYLKVSARFSSPVITFFPSVVLVLLLFCDLFEIKGATDFQNVWLSLTNFNSRFLKYSFFYAANGSYKSFFTVYMPPCFQTLHKKWNYSLRISSVNMTKSVGNYGFGQFYWRNS